MKKEGQKGRRKCRRKFVGAQVEEGEKEEKMIGMERRGGMSLESGKESYTEFIEDDVYIQVRIKRKRKIKTDSSLVTKHTCRPYRFCYDSQTGVKLVTKIITTHVKKTLE